MARARTVKHGFFTNDQLGELEPFVRLLFAGLWTIADRSGRLLDRPKKIKAEVLPYDDVDVDNALSQLARNGFIVRYVVDEQALIQIVNWSKHQHPHPREEQSQLPPQPDAPDEPERTTATNEDDDGSKKPDLGTAEPRKGHDEQGRSPVSGTSSSFPSGSSGTGGPRPRRRARARANAASPPDAHASSEQSTDEELRIDPELEARVDGREHVFRDNDPGRTKLALQRLWVNSGLNRDDFMAVFDDAVDRTMRMLSNSQLQRDSDGRQKGWPMCLQLLRELLAQRAKARNGLARAGPDPPDQNEQEESTDRRPVPAGGGPEESKK